MIIKANNEFETDMEYEEEKIPPLKDNDDVYVEYPVEEKTLMVRRALNMHVNVVDSKGYKENIFQTRYHVYNKVCSLIIDGGSCTNITSAKLMRKLNLHTTKHLIPYKL
jgi:shikimate kinase